MLKVLNVLNSNHRRGAEAFALDLGAALEASGIAVRTVALTASATGSAHDVEALAAAGARGVPWLAHLRTLARESDVIIGHGGRTLVAGALVTTLTRTPFVYRVIGEPGAWASSASRRIRVGAELRRAARIAVYYEGVRPQLEQLAPSVRERIRVIPKGIDTTAFDPVTAPSREAARQRLGLPSDGKIVLYLGALAPAKNVDQVVEAAALVHGALTVLVGDGPDRTRFEARARQHPTSLRLLPATDDPSDALHAADVLALTSRTEGMPTVLLEAALAGVPVVATAVGGVTAIVDDGKTGYIVPIGDVPATTTALELAIDHRAELGAAARRRCLERFDITHVVDAWRALLSEAAPQVEGLVLRDPER